MPVVRPVRDRNFNVESDAPRRSDFSDMAFFAVEWWVAMLVVGMPLWVALAIWSVL